MSDPENKSILILEMQAAHDQLTDALARLSWEDLVRPKTWGEWSFKDLLAHITDWEGRNFSWYLAGLRGETPVTPDPEYDWDHMDALNNAIYLKHKDEPLEAVLTGFDQSWQETLRLVKDTPKDHLFKTGQLGWLKEYKWADVMLGSTTHHYQEHLKDVQAWLDKNTTG